MTSYNKLKDRIKQLESEKLELESEIKELIFHPLSAKSYQIKLRIDFKNELTKSVWLGTPKFSKKIEDIGLVRMIDMTDDIHEFRSPDIP
mgnify:CR=1 FL=1